MRRAVFLDRDGVINRSIVRGGRPFAPVRLEELEVLPGVAEALLRLRKAGFLNIVVTNQPDIATGKQSLATLEAMHLRLSTELAIDGIRVCPHVDADNCACRKPKAGLLLAAARELGIGLTASCMVGDRWRDIEAGQNAGCKTVWIKTDYAEQKPSGFDFEARDLEQAAKWILSSALKSQSR